MGRHKAEPLAALIPGVVRRMGERQGAFFEIQRDWIRLVGRRLAAHTTPVGLRRGVLTVGVDRPGDGFALSYQKPELLERLQATTQGAVKDIVIRPGNARSGERHGRAEERRSPRLR